MKANMLKRLTAALLAASVVAAMPLTASAAWKQTGNVWQWTENGQNATGWRWIQGAWYHFNASGDMTKGWLQENGTWYYLKGTGAMAQGWNLINGKWYCLNSNGSMRTGWVQTKGIWYFLAPNGDMQTGVIQVNGATYYLDETGAMKTGKVEIGGKTYTFNESGAAVGTAPKADKAFNTTSGSTATVPVKEPSKGTGGGGGGGSVTPDPEPPVTKTNIDIGTSTVLDGAFFKEEYGTVTIYTSGLTATDFSKLNAEKVVVKGGTAPLMLLAASDPPTLVFGTNCRTIVVETPIKVEATAILDSVTVSTNNVEIAAPVSTVIVSNPAGATVNVTGSVATLRADKATTIQGVGTGEVVVNANVTVDTNSTVASVTVPATSSNVKVTATGTVPEIVANTAVEVSGTVEKVTVPVGAENVVITGSDGTVKAIEAKAPVDISVKKAGTVTATDTVTVSGGAVTTIEASGNVTVNDGKVTDIVADKPITVTVNKENAVTNVSKTENVGTGEVTVNGSANPSITVGEAAAAPDSTKVTPTSASSTSPTEGSIANGTSVALEYMNAEGTWTEIAANGSASNLAPGTYQVRVKATGEKAASPAIDVIVKAFTGFCTEGDNKDKYYKDSVVVKNAWVTDKDKKEYLTGDDGKALKEQWISKNGKQVWLDKTSGENKGSFGLYDVVGGIDELTGTNIDLQYSVDSGKNWQPCDADNTKIFGLSDTADIQVRVSPRTNNENSVSGARTVQVRHQAEIDVDVPVVVNTANEINAAIKANIPNIKLGKDISVEDAIAFNQSGISYTLDLNGKTLKNEKTTGGKDTIHIINGCNLTIKDSATGGVISSSKNIAIAVDGDITYGEQRQEINSTLTVSSGKITGPEGGILVRGKGATLIVNGGTIEASDNAGVAGNGTKSESKNEDFSGTSITINDGEIIGYTVSTNSYRNCGLYHPQAGNLIVTGGTIKGNNGAGIVMRSGSLTMTGGTVVGHGTGGENFKVGDAVSTYCSGIEVGYDAKYPGGMGNINISGGEIKADEGQKSFMVIGTATAGSTITITGGTFTPENTYNPNSKADDEQSVTPASEEVFVPIPEENTTAPEITPEPPAEGEANGEPTGETPPEAE